MSENTSVDFEFGLSGAYSPTYASNDTACLDAVGRADASSNQFWRDVTDYFSNDSLTTVGDLVESGMDAWDDSDLVDVACDTGGLF